MTVLLLLTALAFAQETPETPPEEPAPAEEPAEAPPPTLGLSADEALQMAAELRANGAGYAALILFAEALAADPDKAGAKLDAMVYLAGHIGDQRLLSTALYHYGVPDTGKPDAISVALHMRARHQMQKGELGAALDTLKQVAPGSAGHADAEALRGVILNQQGKPRAALAAFEVARGAGKATDKGALFDDAMDLNLARTYYATNTAAGYVKAIEYYALVDRGSPWWPEATFERSWAHFMLSDMQGTLALLHNLESPFFEDWFFPEADMLRSQSLFLMCMFEEASTRIERFDGHYGPIAEQIDRVLAGMTAEAAFAEVEAYAKGKSTKLPGALLRPFTYEERFKGAIEASQHADLELSRLATDLPGDTGDLALSLLEERKAQMRQQEGARVLARVRAARAELNQRLQDTKIAKLDILEFERKRYERAAATGTLDEGEEAVQLRKDKRRKGYRYWPYQGESWADELGFYDFSGVSPLCPAEIAAGTR